MDALDHLCQDLRTTRPELHALEERIDEDRCIDLRIGPTRFLLSVLSEWRAGFVVHATLGHLREGSALLREAMQLNSGQATRNDPIYALQGEQLVCRYRLALGEAHAPALVQRLQAVVEQQQAWVAAGWLSLLNEEVCA